MTSGQQPAGTQAARVVVVGGGFGGLSALHALRRHAADRHGRGRPGSGWQRRGHRYVDVTLVDHNVYSTFQPLLYQVATAGLTSADVAYPLWSAARKAGARFRKGDLAGLDADARQIRLADGSTLDYDYLIIAAGVGAAFYGVNGAAEHSLSLYTRRDAIAARDHVMAALEERSRVADDRDLDITVVGGGATGVEMAGTLAELRNIALPAAFPEFDQSRMRVRLIEMAPELLGPFHARLRGYARAELLDRGVDVRLDTSIKEIRPGQVLLADGDVIRSDITIWAAGVSAAAWVAGLGLPTGRGGRLRTGADLRVVGQDRIFAIGDIGVMDDQPLPQLAQPAIQEGKHAAEQIVRLLAGQPTTPMRYKDKGIMATIGHRSAVVDLPSGIRFRGTLAWFAWLALHLLTLLGGRNRISALVNLSWRYLTWSRGGGVIVGDDKGTPAVGDQGAAAVAGSANRPAVAGGGDDGAVARGAEDAGT